MCRATSASCILNTTTFFHDPNDSNVQGFNCDTCVESTATTTTCMCSVTVTNRGRDLSLKIQGENDCGARGSDGRSDGIIIPKDGESILLCSALSWNLHVV